MIRLAAMNPQNTGEAVANERRTTVEQDKGIEAFTAFANLVGSFGRAPTRPKRCFESIVKRGRRSGQSNPTKGEEENEGNYVFDSLFLRFPQITS